MRRGSAGSVRYRCAMMLLASAGGNRVPMIARPAGAEEDTVRGVIHRFAPDSSKDLEDTREHPYDGPRPAEPSAARRPSR
ncbi:hypothetical protein CG717_01600 [Streptomyces sp. CB02613]|nr:hypothetical protein CG717_01600 [Streptomyces sp. CB02613]